MRRHSLQYLWVIAAAVLSSGCGLNMQKNYQKMRGDLISGDFDAADKHLDSVKKDFYSKDNRLLYYMDKGMVLHLGKRYQESNKFLEQAKTTAEELWTESVGKHAAAWVTTDNSLPYQGEDFEKVLIHFVAALNYIGLKQYDSARVEARQVTNKLELYNSKYEEGENVYSDDAFARWLSGKMAETEGGQVAFNDAWIDYKKALSIYEKDYMERYKTPLPKIVAADALRVLDGLGHDFTEEFSQVKAKYPNVQFKTAKEASELGEIVFLHMAGEAPYKVDKYWQAVADGEPIRIAFPEFERKPTKVTGVRISVADTGTRADGELVEDITAIAIQNLNDHMARIQAKAIARAVAKFIAGKAAQAGGKKVGGNAGAALQVAGALWNVGSAVAEEADKRSWITLPARVNAARVFTTPGKVTLNVDFLTRRGSVYESKQFTIDVQPGKATFVSYRTFQ